MSFIYKDGKYNTTRDSFVGRKIYKENAKLDQVKILDTWYQHPNYGLLNKNFEPVILNTDGSGANLNIFGQYSGDGPQAVPFVAEAFDDFRTYYVSTTLDKKVDFPLFIDQVIPKIGYMSFDDQYQNYVASSMNEYASLVLENISSFDQFNDELYKVLRANISKFPVTKSGFLLSEQCPINVSGLCVELAVLDFNSDSEKAKLFDTKEFQCYAEVANVYGFYIDKNAPWRLIANLQSNAMKQYIDRYRPGTDTDIILDKTFRSKTQYEDISSVYYFYAAVFKELLSIVDIQRPYYMPIEEMISTTLKFRMLETGIPMDKFEQNKNDVLDLHRMYSSRFPDDPLRQASGKIGKICSEKIKQIYLAKSKIDSYNTTTLKEYSDFTDPRY